ncbi:MAG: tetratricopeptide repeat protein [Deltaproteobacteria bacterium]|nr:tetratricopeptide repeat protein [Deltaproteobacteria bacterium]
MSFLQRFLLLLVSFSFLWGLWGCATTPRPSSEESPAPPESAEEDVIVKEVKESLTLGKTSHGLYESAYQAYLDGYYEKAIVGFETARLLNPEEMQFWRKLALSYCYLATGRYLDAEKLAKELMDEKPDYWGSYMNAGLAALWQGHLLKASEYFEKASDFQDAEPSLNVYWFITCQLLKKPALAAQKFSQAETNYKEIIKNNPNEEQAFIELAYLYLYSSKNEGEALKLIDQARKIIEDSDNSEKKQVWLDFYFPHLKGIGFYRQGRFRDSILALTGALEKAPAGIRIDLAEVYYYLGKNYQALQETEKAMGFFTKALAIDPLVLYAEEIRSYIGISKLVKKKKS